MKALSSAPCGAFPKSLARTAIGLALVLAAVGTAQAQSQEVVVKLSALEDPQGRVACMLFAQPEGFPSQLDRARVQWIDAAQAASGCRFTDIAPGTYAIGVLHDRNANGRIDTGFKGMPVEPWGVSNNKRSLLREPSFDEARFVVAPGAAPTVVNIRVR